MLDILANLGVGILFALTYVFLRSGYEYHKDMKKMRDRVSEAIEFSLSGPSWAQKVFDEGLSQTQHSHTKPFIEYILKQFTKNFDLTEKGSLKQFRMTGEAYVDLFAVLPVASNSATILAIMEYFDLLFAATFRNSEIKHEKGLLPTIKIGTIVAGYAYNGMPNKEAIEYQGYTKETINRLLAQAASPDKEYEHFREPGFPKDSFTILHVPVVIAGIHK